MRIHASLPGTALKKKKNTPRFYNIKKSPNLAFRTYILAFLRQIVRYSHLSNSSYREKFAPTNYPGLVIFVA